MTTDSCDILIIGGGVVGLASALKLNARHPQLRIVVLEKEAELAPHQTGHNSGVIHAGVYYKPGSYKARLCVQGRTELIAFAEEHGIKHEICGKLIVATSESELAPLQKVFANAQANGVENVELIGPERIKEIEPYCAGIQALRVPGTGIIDYREVTRSYARVLGERHPQSEVRTSTQALSFSKDGGQTVVSTNRGEIKTRFIVACAGIQSDRVAKKNGSPSRAAILGFRGDYYDLSEKGMKKVNHLIYPVPDAKFPFLGVHFTRMIGGGVECGPNAVFVFDREGYGKTDFNFRDTFDAFTFGGTWKFFGKHWRFGVDEYRGAFSKRLFLARLNKLLPSLEMDDIVPARAGIRAMALAPEGEMIDDFKIEKSGSALHVLNAPSPAATASLAIGGEIEKMATEHFGL